MRKSMCAPCLDLAGDILYNSGKCLTKPFNVCMDFFSSFDNFKLYFCGFSLVLVPLIAAYWSVVLALLFAELCVLVTLGLILGVLFVLMGVWPAFIIAAGTTAITVVRLPWNIYYHSLVTYRTVMLRTNLKLVSFVLLPLVHLLIPPFTFLVCLISHVPWFASISFAGYPMEPWAKIVPFHRKFWEKFASDVRRFSENFGHPSGIPRDWDGRVYGLAVDPIAVIISIVLYLISVVPVSLGVVVIFAVKAVPIFLATLVEFWKALNLGTAFKWYWRVLTGSQPTASSGGGSAGGGERSGHAAWSSPLKRATKGARKFIEGYANIQICTVYGERIRNHARRLKYLHPKKLSNLIQSYLNDFSPSKLVKEGAGAAWLVLWIPLLLCYVMYTLGLALVLVVPPLTFIFGFVAWVLCWIPVFALPPLLYLAGWVFIIFGLPALYVLLWGLVLVAPWVLVALGSLSGPLLSLAIPFELLYYNFYNPVEMWSGIKRSLKKVPDILHGVDGWTASLSLGRFRLSRKTEVETGQREGGGKVERVKIDYWDLYVRRCNGEARRIQSLGWLSQDDIQAASATSVIAVPGAAILAILGDSIRKNGKDKTLILWDGEGTECRDSTRDMTDNVANLFWPKVMQVKAGLMGLGPEAAGSAADWITATLCDGEDVKSDQLDKALRELDDEGERARRLKIRAQVENIVHSLLRVRGLNSRLPEMFDTSPKEGEESAQKKEGDTDSDNDVGEQSPRESPTRSDTPPPSLNAASPLLIGDGGAIELESRSSDLLDNQHS